MDRDVEQLKQRLPLLEYLQRHNWSGNIRELRNVVERLVILSGKTITESDVTNFVLV